MEEIVDPVPKLQLEMSNIINELLLQSHLTDDIKLQMKHGLSQINKVLHHYYHRISSNNHQCESSRVTFLDTVIADSNDWKEHVNKVKSEPKFKATWRRPFRLQPSDDAIIGSSNNSLTGIDIRVFSRGCPDDRIYKKSLYARQNLPRGNFIAQFTTDNNSTLYFPLLRAYPKFTGHEDGGELDEIDDEMSSKYFKEPRQNTACVIQTSKENGEAGHLAVLKQKDGSFLYILGSKNVHLVVKSRQDIAAATSVVNDDNAKWDAYAGARPIANAIMSMLESLDKSSIFCEFLAQSRLTASFEVLCREHQHIENLSSFVSDTPVLYGFTFPYLYRQQQALGAGTEICVNPIVGYELATYCGMDVVNYTVLSRSINNTEALKLRREGYVHLFLNSLGQVIGIQKQKSCWYVCLRAIREQSKRMIRTNIDKEGVVNSITKRMKAIASYLKISPDVTNFYKELGIEFLDFVLQQKVDEKRLADFFPCVWQEFLESSGKKDDYT